MSTTYFHCVISALVSLVQFLVSVSFCGALIEDGGYLRAGAQRKYCINRLEKSFKASLGGLFKAITIFFFLLFGGTFCPMKFSYKHLPYKVNKP